MAKEFKNLNDLYSYIEKQIRSSLKSEVANTAVETMRKNIQSEVYDVYEPKEYQRTYELMKKIEVGQKDDDTIFVENVRYDNWIDPATGDIYSNRHVAYIVETGEGYMYDFPYYGVPRPFTEATRKELASSSKLNKAMEKGLKNRGLDVE